jgi:hypothetical protein
MRAATASYGIGTLISVVLSTFAFVAAPSPAASAETQNAASQERVCRDVARSGSRIMDRVCGTPAQVQAYVSQDFYAKASDPRLQAPSGGSAFCWTVRKDGTWDKPCPKDPPTKPTKAGP